MKELNNSFLHEYIHFNCLFTPSQSDVPPLFAFFSLPVKKKKRKQVGGRTFVARLKRNVG